MIIALAGRRVDAPRAETVRFPRENVARVEHRIAAWFAQHEVHAVVCSAASGVDLLGLMTAKKLGIHRRIVLPFPREQFRTLSVVDRGAEWGAYFDVILDTAEAQGEVFALDYAPDNESAYVETNHVILELATTTGIELDQPVRVLVVWDGVSRGDDDVTEAFLKEAYGRDLPVEELSTL
jgi:hypothetical protein